MNKLKVIIPSILVAGCVAVGVAVSIDRIPAGYVGVVYSTEGVEDTTLSQGWHLISPFKHVKEFTIGNKQLILSKDSREGSPDDDSFLVSTADNANISISFQMSYRYQADKVVDTYKQFKGMDGEDIVNSRIKTVLKSKDFRSYYKLFYDGYLFW